MALGKPAVPVVRSADPRSIEGALSAVRERLRAIEAQLGTTSLQAGQSTLTLSQSNSSVANLQAQISALRATVDELDSADGGPTATYIASAVVTQYDVVYATSDGRVAPVDTQDLTAVFGVVGIAENSAAVGGDLTVRHSGTLTVTSAAFDAGHAVYAEAGSGLTQYPSYADVALPVGVALSATTMHVTIGGAALQVLPMYAGYEAFMPVTLSLVRDVLDLVTTIMGQPDGIVVKIGDQFVTRSLIAGSGSGIYIDHANGSTGDPTFELE